MRRLLEGMAAGGLLALAGRVEAAAPLALVGLAPLLAAATRREGGPARGVAAAGLACGGVLYAALLGELFRMPWGPARLTAGVLSVALALGVAGVALAVMGVARRLGPSAGLAAAPVLWVGFEALAGHPPYEIAWLDLAVLMAGEPRLLGLAPLGGAPLVAAQAVATSAVLVACARALRAWRRPPLAALGLVVVLPLLGTAWLAPASGGQVPAAGALRVAVVQPNVRSAERHGAEHLDPNLRELLALSEQALVEEAALLVWPETAWDATAAHGGSHFVGLVAHALETPLLAGTRLRDARGSLRNAVVLATAHGETRRVGDKRHPVPVYEAAPRGALGRRLARRGWWPGRVVPGAPPAPFALPGAPSAAPRLGVVICSDLHDAALVRRLRREGAGLLLTLANESHFGAGAEAANLRLARLRAAENQVPLVRVANTGRSSWLDAGGRSLAELASARAAGGGAVLPGAGAPSFYARHGAGPARSAVLVLAALAVGAGPLRASLFRASRRAPPRGSPLLT